MARLQFTFGVATVLACCLLARAGEVRLASDGKPACVIVSPSEDPLTQRTARLLANYLNDFAHAKPELSSTPPKDGAITRILIDDGAGQPLLASAGVKIDVPTDRADAYAIKVIDKPEGDIVAIAGNTPAGAKYGAYRLMEEMTFEGNVASLPELDVKASPFFATRSISLFNIWRVPVEVIRKCNLEAWPADKVAQNVETYDAFGFNAIETHDRFHEDFLQNVYGISRADWREKVYAMADRAHADGMTVFLRLWGNSVALPVKKIEGGYTPFGFDNLTPDIPAEKARWDKEIRDYASQNYASHIDHLIGHWADAGGVHEGSTATVKDSVLLHNELVDAFRKINPKIDSTFNLWGMANPRGHRGWPGYEGPMSIAGDPNLPEDVTIAQTTRSHSHDYSEQVTADIIAAGHPAAVWTWRRADTEVAHGDTGLRIRIHDLIGNYFNNLPDSARQLAWHNIERNHHGIANDVNYYVTGKLMWDPRADADDLLLKYCQLVFGDDNAKAMAEAFDTIEAARHIEKLVSDDFIKNPQAAAKRAKTARDGVAAVHLASDFKSRLPSVDSVQEMQQELQRALDVIAENASIMAEQLPQIDKLIAGGKSAEANAMIDPLLVKAQKWVDSVDGGVEGTWLKQTLTDRKTGTTDKTQDGFLTRNAKSFEVAEDNSKFTLASDNTEVALAVQPLKTPSAKAIEFHFKFKSEQAGKSRNGGFAFGPSTKSNDLITCQFMLGGKFLRIDGAAVQPVKTAVPNVDADAEHDCVVRLDPEKKTVRFTVDGTTATAVLRGAAPEVRYYGYLVERTRSAFSEITITP